MSEKEMEEIDNELNNNNNNNQIEETNETEVSESIFEDIFALTGFKPEDEELSDDVNGYAKYVDKYANYKLTEYEKSLEKEFPDLYKAILYAKNGGDYYELFQKKNEYSKISFQEDEDFAKDIMREYLKKKNIDDYIIDAAIEKALDDGTIIEKSKGFYESLVEEEKKFIDVKLEEQQKYLSKLEEERVQTINNLQKTITDGVISNNLIIPQQSRKDFLDYVINNTYQNPDGSFSYILNFDKSSINDNLQYLYYVHKKGDLGDLIKRQAQTEVVKRLGKTVGNKEGEKREDSSLTEIFKKLKGKIN